MATSTGNFIFVMLAVLHCELLETFAIPPHYLLPHTFSQMGRLRSPDPASIPTNIRKLDYVFANKDMPLSFPKSIRAIQDLSDDLPIVFPENPYGDITWRKKKLPSKKARLARIKDICQKKVLSQNLTARARKDAYEFCMAWYLT